MPQHERHRKVGSFASLWAAATGGTPETVQRDFDVAAARQFHIARLAYLRRIAAELMLLLMAVMGSVMFLFACLWFVFLAMS